MNIVAFSMTPLFPNFSMGGAQKQLQNIIVYLAEQGHDVTVLCTRRDDAREPFRWHERAQILPLLRFKQPYPEPYFTPVYNIAAAIQDVGDYLRRADRYYCHDGGLIFPYVYQDIPTVISLRSILFAETLQSAFLFQGDALILPSPTIREYFIRTVGRFFPGFAERALAIPNGVRFDVFQPTPPRRILDRIPVDPARDALVLHPHRPEPDKGIGETISVVDLLVNHYGLTHVKALIPRWIDADSAPEVSGFYRALRDRIETRGLREHILFHDWVTNDLMPEYYSMGAVTLSLGSYVETFGNVAYESLACGTPAIVARVGPNRDLLPDGLIDKVDYGDVERAAEQAAAIIRERRRTSEAQMAYLRAHFDPDTMLSAYADTIVRAEKRGPLPYRLPVMDETTAFQIAPWCYRSARGLYHDFKAVYETDAALLALADMPAFSVADAARAGMTWERLIDWYREGYVVPLP